ncbi:hypothetical protein RB195_018266 [Necator americanus]|uniref:Uncharacterized protein n=1 Tax=Necator americanus TaxID=51031 RepID=A0ABR1C8X2_NECAM
MKEAGGGQQPSAGRSKFTSEITIRNTSEANVSASTFKYSAESERKNVTPTNVGVKRRASVLSTPSKVLRGSSYKSEATQGVSDHALLAMLSNHSFSSLMSEFNNKTRITSNTPTSSGKKESQRTPPPENFNGDERQLEDHDSKKPLLWVLAAAPMLVFLCLTVLYIYFRRKTSTTRKAGKILTKKPHEILGPTVWETQPETPNLKEFKDKGPLVMQYAFRGDVKHALQDVHSASLKGIVFDAAQNSIVNIGTEVERVEGASQRTQRMEVGATAVEDIKTCLLPDNVEVVGSDEKITNPQQTSTTESYTRV